MKKILFFVLFVLSIGTRAQITIGMSQVAPAVDGDTVAPGYVNTYTVWVKNMTSVGTTFNDNLTIYTAVRDSVVPGQLDTVGIMTTFIPVIINAGDSAAFTLTETLNVAPASYRYGIDVIVVWPVALSAQTTDSLEYWVYIMDGASIGELDINELVKFYPNPATNYIQLESNDIEQVNIYDNTGRLVISRKKESCINIDELPPGMYMADIELGNKKHRSAKFLKR